MGRLPGGTLPDPRQVLITLQRICGRVGFGVVIVHALFSHLVRALPLRDLPALRAQRADFG